MGKLSLTVAAWIALGVSAGYLVTVSSTAVVTLSIIGVVVVLWARARRPVLPWFALLPIVLASVTIPGVKVPLFDIGAAVAIILCLDYEDEEPTRLPAFLVVALAGCVAVATMSIVIVNPPLSGAISRILHLALFGLLIWAIAAGKIKKENLTIAIVVGLGVSSVLGAITLGLRGGVAGGGYYSARLTGLFGDPNVASLITVALGMVALSSIETRRHRQLLIALMCLTVGLSYSRTGLLALCVALAWSYGIHKAPASVGTLVVFLVVVTAFALPSQIQTLGPYASHASSDQFRAVIDQASFLDMRQHFIFGSGAGTATIQLPSGTFYFHNSFEALVAEFGIPGTVLYAIVAISTVTALFTCTRRSPMIEAAFLSLLIMSLTVGEVLFAFTAAVVIGTSWRYVLLERRREVAGMPHEALSVA